MIIRTRDVILAGLLLACAADIASASDWRMDHAGSKLEYIATFQKARTSGVFKEFDTQVRFDENRLTDSRIDVTVAVETADMIDSEVNKSIRGPDWFDSARFPQAEFHANDVRRLGENRYLARGTLSIKGVEQQAEVPFVWTDLVDSATMAGELMVKRAAFHIGLGEWASTEVIGPDVTVRFSVRLLRTS